ncbi:hypothetical protein BpHYR1_023100 [Brachionus plicatilis]|uniref:Uncharacterized protein n=1 Tax=Brachionus plicatilis TaxID=10195 RepID=A0A3M7T3A5_BRAPC|nr:hypothetical protein BpHYR1_023100 [Brachionus plicatilis]
MKLRKKIIIRKFLDQTKIFFSFLKLGVLLVFDDKCTEFSKFQLLLVMKSQFYVQFDSQSSVDFKINVFFLGLLHYEAVSLLLVTFKYDFF